MAGNLNNAEFLADNISQKLLQLIHDYKSLRKELSLKSSGGLELDKAFVVLFQNNILDNASFAAKNTKLEHMLMTRG